MPQKNERFFGGKWIDEDGNVFGNIWNKRFVGVGEPFGCCLVVGGFQISRCVARLVGEVEQKRCFGFF